MVSFGDVEQFVSLDKFPTATQLWVMYKTGTGLTDQQEIIIEEPYYTQREDRTPRYYQRNAINLTVEAIARGQNRILLVMATGTGKTFTAFQIIWRLWKAGVKKRILYLADRNALIDQTYVNDFSPFKDKMTIVRNRKVDKSYEIYLALYQGLTGEGDKEIFKQFSPGFFDLIIVDECHRGSAKEDSAWRAVLEYFSTATQIGLTATPKETKDVSNMDYFGEPIYTYSLKQGIEDGFLAPYRVIRIILDKVDIIVTNPPFGGAEERAISQSVPAELRDTETADLFLVHMMALLKDGGRCGMVLPDGFLFGTGVKSAIKKKLLEDCSLHTIIRLPKDVFAPYTNINTNLLFFQKGTPTKGVWYYRLEMPKGYKHFSKTRPMLPEHFRPVRDWWNNRTESDISQFVSVEDIIAADYSLDFCGFPHDMEEILPPEQLISRYLNEKVVLSARIEDVLARISAALEQEDGV